MVIYRVDYEQRRINEQITVPKHTWKVQRKKYKNKIIII